MHWHPISSLFVESTLPQNLQVHLKLSTQFRSELTGNSIRDKDSAILMMSHSQMRIFKWNVCRSFIYLLAILKWSHVTVFKSRAADEFWIFRKLFQLISVFSAMIKRPDFFSFGHEFHESIATNCNLNFSHSKWPTNEVQNVILLFNATHTIKLIKRQ